ncbi:MAG: selenide, water dikinase SelD [Candidatus Coatesbacteria bacterium]|nr:selenide, water dikinase SelD [Candidatus Coatesbacteria bacterium]
MLDALPPVNDERLLSPVHHADDAGAVRLGDGRVLLATTDFFTPVVDDPRAYGRIAAANALSDIYAMGAKPLGALNIACYPDRDFPLEYLIEVLQGGQEKMAEAGVVLLGGHTVTDQEFKYGLAAFAIHPEGELWENSGARPGDFIAITKPLGTGILATALKADELSAEGLELLTSNAEKLNGYAADIARAFKPHACTDVTGFGLAGHAAEVARNSAVRLVFDLDHLPVISDEVFVQAEEGLKPGGLFKNLKAYADFVSLAPERDAEADKQLIHLAHDPQTSGGLLFFDDADKWADYKAAFVEAGHFIARVGRVEEGEGIKLC